MEKIFDGQKMTKLGTEKKPAVVHVRTKERLGEVASIFKIHGWKYSIGVEKGKPVNITVFEILFCIRLYYAWHWAYV